MFNIILNWIINNLPAAVLIPAIIVIVTFVLARKFPTFDEKIKFYSEVTEEVNDLKEFYKKEYEEIRKQYEETKNLINDIKNENIILKDEIENLKTKNINFKNEIEKLKIKVSNLNSCKKRYYKCLDYLIDLFEIAKRENFENKLPPIDSKIVKDIKKRK